MVIVLTAALAVLGFIVLVYVLALTAGRIVQAIRSRRHIGTYRVRIGPPDARGFEGDDLDVDYVSLNDARAAAKETLLGLERDGDVAFVLAERDDGEWDVVDRIDVLA